nr:MAG TPA: hypothetical protein [Caudoviricetes sp.]
MVQTELEALRMNDPFHAAVEQFFTAAVAGSGFALVLQRYFGRTHAQRNSAGAEQVGIVFGRSRGVARDRGNHGHSVIHDNARAHVCAEADVSLRVGDGVNQVLALHGLVDGRMHGDIAKLRRTVAHAALGGNVGIRVEKRGRAALIADIHDHILGAAGSLIGRSHAIERGQHAPREHRAPVIADLGRDGAHGIAAVKVGGQVHDRPGLIQALAHGEVAHARDFLRHGQHGRVIRTDVRVIVPERGQHTRLNSFAAVLAVQETGQHGVFPRHTGAHKGVGVQGTQNDVADNDFRGNNEVFDLSGIGISHESFPLPAQRHARLFRQGLGLCGIFCVDFALFSHVPMFLAPGILTSIEPAAAGPRTGTARRLLQQIVPERAVHDHALDGFIEGGDISVFAVHVTAVRIFGDQCAVAQGEPPSKKFFRHGRIDQLFIDIGRSQEVPANDFHSQLRGGLLIVGLELVAFGNDRAGGRLYGLINPAAHNILVFAVLVLQGCDGFSIKLGLARKGRHVFDTFQRGETGGDCFELFLALGRLGREFGNLPAARFRVVAAFFAVSTDPDRMFAVHDQRAVFISFPGHLLLLAPTGAHSVVRRETPRLFQQVCPSLHGKNRLNTHFFEFCAKKSPALLDSYRGKRCENRNISERIALFIKTKLFQGVRQAGLLVRKVVPIHLAFLEQTQPHRADAGFQLTVFGQGHQPAVKIFLAGAVFLDFRAGCAQIAGAPDGPGPGDLFKLIHIQAEFAE